MKKFILFLITFIVLFTSCNKDDSLVDLKLSIGSRENYDTDVVYETNEVIIDTSDATAENVYKIVDFDSRAFAPRQVGNVLYTITYDTEQNSYVSVYDTEGSLVRQTTYPESVPGANLVFDAQGTLLTQEKETQDGSSVVVKQ